MVVRDGRLFENEVADVVFEILGSRTSLFEYRKGGNPSAVTLGTRTSPLPAPFAVQVPDTDTMFLAPAAPRGVADLPAAAKVVWRGDWNRLGLEASEIASILASQTLTPGLGLHQSNLPAAVYWADGVAGATDSDLRFRGNAPTIL